MRNKSFDFFHLLRAFATLNVVGAHVVMAAQAKALSLSAGNFWFYGLGAGCVWIFFVLSGYLAALGYQRGKYVLSPKGILRYYLQKVFKIFLPALLIIALISFFVHPEETLKDVSFARDVLTMTYDGVPDVGGTGAIWYVFTLMWLYLVSPLLGFVFEGAKRRWGEGRFWNVGLFVLFLLLLGGGAYLRYDLTMVRHMDWMHYVYTAPYAQLDLFIGGFALCYVRQEKGGGLGAFPACGFASILIMAGLASWVLFKGKTLVYVLAMPSIFLVYMLVFTSLYRRYSGAKQGWFWGVVNWFSGHSYPFYLIHAAVLYSLARIPSLGNFTSMNGFFLTYFGLGTLITLLISLGYETVTRSIAAAGKRLEKRLGL